MANPKKRTSKSKKGMRRSHHHLSAVNFVYCSCGEATLPHTICPSCGKYRGRQFLRREDNE
ncbi:MAG: 50S ribosomal protein L32 [Desulfonauticus sp.]|nr:50S ribosomal protein L32 [Desulfonauticus sp.]